MDKKKYAQFGTIVLYDLGSSVNMGQIMRTCEQFDIWMQIYDPRGLWESKIDQKTVSDFSCGALGRFEDIFMDDFVAYRKASKGRVIATCLEKDSVSLPDFKFEVGDMVLMGNEYDGLPQEIIDGADAKLYIPLPENFVPKPQSFAPIDPARIAEVNQQGVPNLSVSATSAIVAYALHLQREARKYRPE